MINKPANWNKPLSILLLALLLNGCVNFEYHATQDVSAIRVNEDSPEAFADADLLNVGIELLDPGLDLIDDETSTFVNIRKSEAVWFSSQLKDALQYSNVWGVVRVIPQLHLVSDLMIKGKVIESTGEELRLQIDVSDSSGRQWLSKEYFQRVSAYAYNPEFKTRQDPFQSLFNEVANDLLGLRADLDPQQAQTIRNISKVRFAKEFSPKMFSDYLSQDEKELFTLSRLPADNDPMMKRIERIQSRNDLFLDVVQDYYHVFNENMSEPYDVWRGLSYKEVVYQRQLKAQARKEKFAGVAAIIAGVLAQTSGNASVRSSGHVAILGGATILRSGYLKADEAILHGETLRELGASLEAELEPSVINLQDRSITLSGTVEDQYAEWRKILAEMFRVEQGLPVEDNLLETQP